jgi:alanyl-tRNA synthetase
VTGCKKTADGALVHICKIESGEIKTGAEITASVDEPTRQSIQKNHTAAHLLQSALRRVLGSHVEQSGSYVDGERVRFDFTHFSALTAGETEKTEDHVNAGIFAALDVSTLETDVESAKKMGALALFGEKYGESVRVVKIGEASTELCGGTHAENTSRLGLFKILSETSIAAGVRRIEGTTGKGVLDIIRQDKLLIKETAEILKSNNPGDIAKRSRAVSDELRDRKREIDALREKLAAQQIEAALLEPAKPYYTFKADPGAAKSICEKITQKYPESTAVVASITPEKITITAACGKAAVKSGAHAGNLVKQIAALCGGNGGGRPEFAVAGGKDASKVDEAVERGAEILRGMTRSFVAIDN